MKPKKHLLKMMTENADFLFNNQEYEEAGRKWDEILELDPKDSKAWHNRGAVYFELGDLPEALRCINTSLKLRKESTSLYMKALILAKLGKLLDALVCLDSSLEINDERMLSGVLEELRSDFISKMSVESLVNYYWYYYPESNMAELIKS